MSSDLQTSQETESLVLRLAGPSTTKAGYVSTCHNTNHASPKFMEHHMPASQLNRQKLTVSLRRHPRALNSMRFIHSPTTSSVSTTQESHFNLQNEKRKDKEVTARIERILKLRDQSVKGVDIGTRMIFILGALQEMTRLSVSQSGAEGRPPRAHPRLHDGSECDFC